MSNLSDHHLRSTRRGIWPRLKHFFRERQIYVRSQGEVQFITLRPFVMVIGLFVLTFGLFWMAFATIDIAFKDELLVVKERNLYQARLQHEDRISELQQKIDSLNEKLMIDQHGYLKEVDTLRAEYGQLIGKHQQLTNFFRQTWLPAVKPKKSKSGNSTPNTSPKSKPAKQSPQGFIPNKKSKGSFNQKAPPRTFAHVFTKNFSSQKDALAPVRMVKKELGVYDQLQVNLLDEVVSKAQASNKRFQKIYKKLGVNPKRVLKANKHSTGDAIGGPFIAATESLLISKAVSNRMKKVVLHLNQKRFLQSQAKRLPIAMPVRNISRFSSHFGIRRDPFRKVAAMHTGIDIKAPYATKVRSTADGIVISAGRAGGYGLLVKVRHKYGLVTRYAHLKKILVEKGQSVKLGQGIGLLGSTGRSTGAHLHYETRLNGRALNPTRFWKARHDFQSLSK